MTDEPEKEEVKVTEVKTTTMRLALLVHSDGNYETMGACGPLHEVLRFPEVKSRNFESIRLQYHGMVDAWLANVMAGMYRETEDKLQAIEPVEGE